MISQQVKTMGVAGVVLVIACVGIGVWFTMALTKSQQTKSELDSAHRELEKICKEKIFPNANNIERIQEDQEMLETWIEAVTNQLATSDIPLTDATPAKFKSDLEDAIRELVRNSAAQGRPARVTPDFRFGFDKYRGDVLPERADVPRLNQQLDIIKLLVAELYEANVVRLDVVTREVFEAGATTTREDSGTSARRSNRRPADGGGTAAAARPAAGDMFESQRFTVALEAHPDTFADVLNRLATMDIFVVVSEVDIKKTADSVARREPSAREATSRQTNQFTDDSDAPPVVQIVTNPQDEPPVTVRLVLDVYSFKGV